MDGVLQVQSAVAGSCERVRPMQMCAACGNSSGNNNARRAPTIKCHQQRMLQSPDPPAGYVQHANIFAITRVRERW